MIKYYINNVTKAPYKLENGYLFIHRSANRGLRTKGKSEWKPSVYTESALAPKENSYFTEISEEEMTLFLLDRSP